MHNGGDKVNLKKKKKILQNVFIVLGKSQTRGAPFLLVSGSNIILNFLFQIAVEIYRRI